MRNGDCQEYWADQAALSDPFFSFDGWKKESSGENGDKSENLPDTANMACKTRPSSNSVHGQLDYAPSEDGKIKLARILKQFKSSIQCCLDIQTWSFNDGLTDEQVKTVCESHIFGMFIPEFSLSTAGMSCDESQHIGRLLKLLISQSLVGMYDETQKTFKQLVQLAAASFPRDN